jgi:hypothetical protein
MSNITTYPQKMSNTFFRYHIAIVQIKKLQIRETIGDEEHVSGEGK